MTAREGGRPAEKPARNPDVEFLKGMALSLGMTFCAWAVLVIHIMGDTASRGNWMENALTYFGLTQLVWVVPLALYHDARGRHKFALGMGAGAFLVFTLAYASCKPFGDPFGRP